MLPADAGNCKTRPADAGNCKTRAADAGGYGTYHGGV